MGTRILEFEPGGSNGTREWAGAKKRRYDRRTPGADRASGSEALVSKRTEKKRANYEHSLESAPIRRKKANPKILPRMQGKREVIRGKKEVLFSYVLRIGAGRRLVSLNQTIK